MGRGAHGVGGEAPHEPRQQVERIHLEVDLNDLLRVLIAAQPKSGADPNHHLDNIIILTKDTRDSIAALKTAPAAVPSDAILESLRTTIENLSEEVGRLPDVSQVPMDIFDALLTRIEQALNRTKQEFGVDGR